MDLIRIVGRAVLLPLPVALLLVTAGWVLLRRGWRPRLGRWLVGGGALLLFLASTATVPRWALGSLEDDYPPYRPAAAAPPPEAAPGTGGPTGPDAPPAPDPTGGGPRWIVVLCGGSGDPAGWPDVAGLTSHTLGRVAEGVRIARLHPDARVLVTGGAARGRRPCSDVMRGAAVELGVEPERIVRDTLSRTTEDEAVAIERTVGDDPFVLVTAASHLPRAVDLVRARGLDPIPAPAAPRVVGDPPGLLGRLKPDAEALLASHLWSHEVLARLWSRLRGRL